MSNQLIKLEMSMLNGINQPTTTSRDIAKVFDRMHKNVLQDIRSLKCGDEFAGLNFQPTEYVDLQGKTKTEYLITRDGFTILVMGYNGKKAMEFKIKYIASWNQMASFIQQQIDDAKDLQIKQLEASKSTITDKQFLKLNNMVVELYNKSLVTDESTLSVYKTLQFYKGNNPFVLSLKHQLATNGKLSDKQVACMLKGGKRKS